MSFRTPPGSAVTRIASPRAERVTIRPLLLALLLPLAACLSQDEQNSVLIHLANSKAYYDAGEYARAEDQCRRGLAIDADNATLKLTLGYSLLMQSSEKRLDEAIALFDDQRGTFSTPDWRVEQGSGIALLQLARVHARSKKPAKLADVAQLRAEARAALEAAASASAATNNTPPEVPFHLALLDLDEKRMDDFDRHAAQALQKLQAQDKICAAQLSQPMGTTEHTRTEHDRQVNAERGKLLARELAQYNWQTKDYAQAAIAMETLEGFGALGLGDWLSRARIRAAVGDDERAVTDFEKYILLSSGHVDDTVNQAVKEMMSLRSKLAEKRTAQPSVGR